MKEYKLLGIEEMDYVCEFCGKKQISVCYTVENSEGKILRFGSSCIKKALKVSSVQKLISSTIESINNEYYHRIKRLSDEVHAYACTWRRENGKKSWYTKKRR